jgi:chromosome segregation ATPase
MTRRYFTAVLAVSILGVHATAIAQTQRSGGEAQKFMQQYQQLAAEKTALQGQVAQMKKDLDAAKTDLAAMKKERDALKAHVGAPAAAVAQLTTSKDAAERNLEQSKQRMTELVGRFREMATNLKDVEADRAKLRDDLTKRSSAFDKCAEDNLQLYEINGEILDRYEHVGLFTKVSAAEPFTKITRTRIENLVDEYRERAQQLRVKKSAPTSLPGTNPPNTSSPGTTPPSTTPPAGPTTPAGTMPPTGTAPPSTSPPGTGA